MLTKDNYRKRLEENFAAGLAIMLRKNEDYAHGADPFKNFRVAASQANVSTAKGILVRMGDKMTRVGNLLEKQERGLDASVVEESISDTLSDLMNYANILAVWILYGDHLDEVAPARTMGDGAKASA